MKEGEREMGGRKKDGVENQNMVEKVCLEESVAQGRRDEVGTEEDIVKVEGKFLHNRPLNLYVRHHSISTARYTCMYSSSHIINTSINNIINSFYSSNTGTNDIIYSSYSSPCHEPPVLALVTYYL